MNNNGTMSGTETVVCITITILIAVLAFWAGGVCEKGVPNKYEHTYSNGVTCGFGEDGKVIGCWNQKNLPLPKKERML